jgi:acyl carrier protein phosphodiesterase
MYNIQNQNKTINSTITQKIITLEEKIILMEQSLQDLQHKYEENNKLLSQFIPTVGKKRKRFWIGF